MHYTLLAETLSDYLVDRGALCLDIDHENQAWTFTVEWCTTIDLCARRLLHTHRITLEEFEDLTADYSYTLEHPEVHSDILNTLNYLVEEYTQFA